MEYKEDFEVPDQHILQGNEKELVPLTAKTVSFNILKLVKIKHLLLSIMQKEQILQKYGENICQSVINMLLFNNPKIDKDSIIMNQLPQSSCEEEKQNLPLKKKTP